MEEIFKTHKSGYLISNYGRIKGKTKEFLKISTNKEGYCSCGKIGWIHRAVYETFIGEIPINYQINHKDYNRQNNKLDNLELCTASENVKHSKLNPARKKITGENNPMSHLSENDVIDIYNMIKNGNDNIDIAIKYHLHDRYVSLIRHGKRWKHLYKKHFNYDDKYHYSLGLNFLNKEKIFNVLTLITNTTKSNEEIAKEVNLDKTLISAVRHKRIWGRAWRYFLKEKNPLAKSFIKGSQGKNNPSAKLYKIISPDGKIFEIIGEFKNFCEEKNISFGVLFRTLKTNKPILKGKSIGWQAFKV